MRTPNRKYNFETDRVVVWWSNGAPSTLAGYLALQKCPRENVNLVLCDTGGEHPDNVRFRGDIEKSLNHPILVFKNEKYTDHRDVYRQRKWLISEHGAPCTEALKKSIRRRLKNPSAKNMRNSMTSKFSVIPYPRAGESKTLLRITPR